MSKEWQLYAQHILDVIEKIARIRQRGDISEDDILVGPQFIARMAPTGPPGLSAYCRSDVSAIRRAAAAIML